MGVWVCVRRRVEGGEGKQHFSKKKKRNQIWENKFPNEKKTGFSKSGTWCEKCLKREKNRKQLTEKRDLVNQETGFRKFGSWGMMAWWQESQTKKTRKLFWLCSRSSIDFFIYLDYDPRARGNNHAAKLAARPKSSQSHMENHSKLMK